MGNLGVEIALVVLFIIVGGMFAAAEIALISLRESQIKRLVETRGKRARRLARLVSDPNRFLAAVQIGVTVATMLSSAFGAATLAGRLSGPLQDLGLSAGAADVIALVGITLILAFVSLVLGELAPKRLGLQRSEAIALMASGPLSLTATLFRPVVWVLGKCTNGVVRILGGDPHQKGEVITEEELQGLVAAHESLSSVERRVISDVFAAEDTLVREVMVARPEVEFLPAGMTLSRAIRHTAGLGHSRFPVIGRDADEVVGVAHITDILNADHPLGRTATVGDVAKPVSLLPGTKSVLDALQEMRGAGRYLAVVVDEYGGTDGIITIEDLVEEIVGEMRPESEIAVAPLSDADGLDDEVDGRLNLDDFAEQTGIDLPAGPYDTAGGFIMAELGHIPKVGDRVLVLAQLPVVADAADSDADEGSQQLENDQPDAVGVSLVVAAMEGRRISRIQIDRAGFTPQTPPPLSTQ